MHNHSHANMHNLWCRHICAIGRHTVGVCCVHGIVQCRTNSDRKLYNCVHSHLRFMSNWDIHGVAGITDVVHSVQLGLLGWAVSCRCVLGHNYAKLYDL